MTKAEIREMAGQVVKTWASEPPPQTDEACGLRRLLTVEVDSGRCSSRGSRLFKESSDAGGR